MIGQKGQSLLEIAVTIGVIVVIVVGLAIVTVNGLRNSQFSKNQTQATKLAQETLEKIKVIKVGDLAVCGSAFTAAEPKWSDLWAMTLNTACGGVPCTFDLKENGGCSVSPSIFYLEQSSTPETLLQGSFKRQITIEDVADPNPQKKATVTILWSDASGNHESKLTTILAKY